MLTDVEVYYRNSRKTEVIDLPNICPHCGQIMTPYVYKGFSSDSTDQSKRIFGILVRCTASDCKKFFSLRYGHGFPENKSSYSNELIPDTYRPPIQIDLPENINQVSEKFVEIYSQATQAETDKLDQIAGVGYRKSLEFLIKDYAIKTNPNNKDKIEKMFLGKVIEQYLNNFPKLQNLATAATWIGNDETHYVRRHTNKDIRDMKVFIRSASQFIAADYDADLAQNFIEES